jgi:inosine-uridine nucleoside N-ribohydrolase
MLLLSCLGGAQQKRKVIIDQDAAGPGGTDQQSMLLLIQSPQTEVLGITVVTGDQWLNEEVAHTLRMLELIGRTDIPVVPGAEYPLVRQKEETERWEREFGVVPWVGAWTPKYYHPADELGAMPEGKPTTQPSSEDAAHFLLRMVRQYPHQVTIYEGGPMREFNLWFDPEAARIVLRAPWEKIVCTPVDISVKTRLTEDLIRQIKVGNSPAARYVGQYARLRGNYNYLWDELAAAAWLDPGIITKKETLFLDIDLDRGAGYGNTLSWTEANQPKAEMRPVEVQDDLDLEKFYRMFVALLSGPTPGKN